ncbi:serine carboxypeptidase [Pilatotrama ljubarskyi]|nr:serine carboxypeptidase [Pilatotrama ljubarskyi]
MYFCNLLSLLGVLSAAAVESLIYPGLVGLPEIGSQTAFRSVYDTESFNPLGDLSALSSTDFAHLKHPAFPRYSVRVKKSRFCDEEVNAYTGYIDIEAHHLFFYFFESRRDTDADDVIYWTNGGPGGSSSLGLFMELGPCRVTGANTTKRNPWSWNEHANIFFVDQPVDVGFSYAEHGEAVRTTQEAAQDITAFIAIFFEHFTKFRGRALHLAGESYGGRYIPVFASTIYDRNAELEKAGLTPINLTSVMIGNGCTNFGAMFPSYYEAQCADPTFPPVNDIASCVRMKELLPRCEKRYRESCVENFDAVDCQAAAHFCNSAINNYYQTHNSWDRSRPCTGMRDVEDCYPIVRDLQDFLSNNETQIRLGVDPPKRGNFTYSSQTVSEAFWANIDWFGFPAQYYLEALLERNVRVLVYVGATDYICNWIGNEKMTVSLEWSRQDEFRELPLVPWIVQGDVAGLTRSGGGMTFATIAGAGHMAPYDRPVESLELAKRWLAGGPL